jgi:phosphoribosylformylglycinamidine (FGAM) synthase-like amidotransferase family enzyme
MQVTFNGAVMFDGTAPIPVVHGSGTYTCTQDQLQITNPGDPLVATYSRNG